MKDTLEDGTSLTVLHKLWKGVRNLVASKIHTPIEATLTTPKGEVIMHPGTVLAAEQGALSPRHPFFHKVQYVDPQLWYQYWRLSFLGRQCRSKYMPHQGVRERQRRIVVW